MFFIYVFLITILYVVVSIGVTTIGFFLAGRRGAETVGEAVLFLFGTNNRRWCFLLVITAITLMIAISKPGNPLILDTARTVKTEIKKIEPSPSTKENIRKWTDFVLYGNNPPYREKVIPIPKKEPEIKSWFWWKASAFYAICTFIYFFFAFADEVATFLGRLRDHFFPQVPPQAPPAAPRAPAPQGPQQGGPSRWLEMVIEAAHFIFDIFAHR